MHEKNEPPEMPEKTTVGPKLTLTLTLQRNPCDCEWPRLVLDKAKWSPPPNIPRR